MFRHRYYDAFGKRRERSKQGFKTEKDAYRALREVSSSILNGDVKQVEIENLTIAEWLDIWYETKKSGWKISTARQRKDIIKRIIKPLIGKRRLFTLDLITYERLFIIELLKNYEPVTAKLYHNTFKISVNAAVANKTIKENNFKYIKIPDNRKKEDNFLNESDLNTILNIGKQNANITNYTLLLTLANTGMQKGEAHGLTWKDIDCDKKTIKIERTRDLDGDRPPKGTRSYRTILVDDDLIKQLKIYHIWCKQLKLSFGEHLVADDYVFYSKRGNPVSCPTINFILDRIIEKANVKRITPHGLRHTHAKILLNRGVSVATVAKRLGNTAEEINRTYGHSDDDADKRAVEVFKSVVSM